MSVEIAIVPFTLSPAGDLDIVTEEMNGVTPKAALFFSTNGAVLGTPRDFTTFCIGACDSTRQWAIGGSSQHGATTTLSNRRFSNTICIGRIDTSNNFIITGTFVKFLSTTDTGDNNTGVRININTGFVVQGFCILFGGTEVQAYASTALLDDKDVTQQITAPGFRSNMTFFAMDGKAPGHAASTQGAFGFGWASNDGTTILQSGYGRSDRDNVTTTEQRAQVNSARVGCYITSSTPFQWAVEMGDNANGFSVTARDNRSAINDHVAYLALEITGRSVWAGMMNSPTATGNDAQTGPGFRPALVGLIPNMVTAVDALKINAEAGSFGFSAFTQTQEACGAVAGEDAVTTSNTESVFDDDAVDLNDEAGAAAFDATFVSMDANGWTLNFSAVDGATRKWPAFAIAAASGGYPAGMMMGL